MQVHIFMLCAGPWSTRSFWPASNTILSRLKLMDDNPAPLIPTPQRNGTLSDVYTIHTGQNGMENFGYYDRINGEKKLPFWPSAPCNNIRASEGSLFPPRELTGSDTVFVYDKDVCRTLPFTYTKPVIQNGMWEAFSRWWWY